MLETAIRPLRTVLATFGTDQRVDVITFEQRHIRLGTIQLRSAFPNTGRRIDAEHLSQGGGLKDELKLTLRRDGIERTVDDVSDVRCVGRNYRQTLGVPVLVGRGLTAKGDARFPSVLNRPL